MPTIAVIDDQELLRDSLAQTLRRSDYRVSTFADGQTALDAICKGSFDMIITDMRMADLDGVELLRQVRLAGMDLPVIMMTAFGTIASAVEAMKLGAYDYIQKPFEAEEIELLVDRAMRERQLRRENEALRRTVSDWYHGRELVGSPEGGMARVKDQIARVANSQATVLIEGESGTGKELVSRAIHAASDRADRPFMCLNCAALSDHLLESELFGHEKGAFTGADKMRKGRFELADGGTLLLDEISEIHPTLQAKLLRVLQEKQFERVGSSVTRDVDVRVIATTNRNLRQCMHEGTFREDLYYRLSVLPIFVPPLRRHREDIVVLAEYFLGRLADRDARTHVKLDRQTIQLLEGYHWPGNVRELENLIERAWVLTAGREITAEVIAPWLTRPKDPVQADNFRAGHLMEDTERELIVKTLAEFNGHRAKTAAALGIGLRTLGLKLKRWKQQDQNVFDGADFAPAAQFVP